MRERKRFLIHISMIMEISDNRVTLSKPTKGTKYNLCMFNSRTKKLKPNHIKPPTLK